MVGLTSNESEETFDVMMVAIGNCLSSLASSNDGKVRQGL